MRCGQGIEACGGDSVTGGEGSWCSSCRLSGLSALAAAFEALALVVSVSIVVVCIVIRLLWLRVFASEGVLLSESSVVTCESRPLYLTLPAWGSVSLRRGVGCAWRGKFTLR